MIRFWNVFTWDNVDVRTQVKTLGTETDEAEFLALENGASRIHSRLISKAYLQILMVIGTKPVFMRYLGS